MTPLKPQKAHGRTGRERMKKCEPSHEMVLVDWGKVKDKAKGDANLECFALPMIKEYHRQLCEVGLKYILDNQERENKKGELSLGMVPILHTPKVYQGWAGSFLACSCRIKKEDADRIIGEIAHLSDSGFNNLRVVPDEAKKHD